MTEALVQGIDVSRHFKHGNAEIQALKPATFDIASGARIAIVGPSGSGKSTLLHLIADLDRPTGGRLSWPAMGPGGTLRPAHIGVVFQAPSLIPTLSALENVELPLCLKGTASSVREIAMRALKSVKLDTVADKMPAELSGGQMQRVAVARAIALRPRLVLADEPTGQLDQSTAQEVIDVLIRALDETDAALVITTHDPAVARRMDITWHIDHGQLDTEALPQTGEGGSTDEETI